MIHVTGKALAGISIFPLGNAKFTPTCFEGPGKSVPLRWLALGLLTREVMLRQAQTPSHPVVMKRTDNWFRWELTRQCGSRLEASPDLTAGSGTSRTEADLQVILSDSHPDTQAIATDN